MFYVTLRFNDDVNLLSDAGVVFEAVRDVDAGRPSNHAASLL